MTPPGRGVTFRPTTGRGFDLGVEFTTLEGMRLFRFSCIRGAEIRKTTAFDGFTFVLPTADVPIMHAAGRATALDLRQGLAFDSIATEGWSLPSGMVLDGLAIENARVTSYLAHTLDNPVTHRLAIEGGEGTRQLAGAMVPLFQALRAGVGSKDGVLRDNPSIRLMEEALLALIVHGVAHNYSAQIRGHVSSGASWQLRRAIEFMQANLTSPIGTVEIAVAAGLGLRSMQSMFRQQLGTTPTAHLKRLRLERAHEDVLAGERTLAEIARQWGFASPRQFAADYRAMFGRLPSEAAKYR